MISTGISEYPRSFGRKVFGEILSASGPEFCAVRTLQTALEVVVLVTQLSEFLFQRSDFRFRDLIFSLPYKCEYIAVMSQKINDICKS